MTELQDDIINELYFVTPYQEVFEQLSAKETEFQAALTELLQQGLVAQYQRIDFEKCAVIDYQNLTNYSYLATKKGLLKHVGMS